jgi:hypothetical protein
MTGKKEGAHFHHRTSFEYEKDDAQGQSKAQPFSNFHLSLRYTPASFSNKNEVDPILWTVESPDKGASLSSLPT